MPGAPFLHDVPTYQGVQGEGVRMNAPMTGATGNWSFLFWLVLIGVVLPVLILGGLKVGGFSFVFRNR